MCSPIPWRDTAGLTSNTQITVTIQGANDTPSDITGALSVAENSPNGAAVGTLSTQTLIAVIPSLTH